MTGQIKNILKKFTRSSAEVVIAFYHDSPVIDNAYQFENVIFLLADVSEKHRSCLWNVCKKTPMLAKLAEHYNLTARDGNYGYGVGFYTEPGVLKPVYDFPKGRFVLSKRTIEDDLDFCHWEYQPKI